MHHCLADFAAQVEGYPSIARAEQAAQFQRVSFLIGDLEYGDAAIPAAVGLHRFDEARSDAFDVRRRIDIEEDGAEQIGRLCSPVLERLFEKIGHRHDHAPIVPDAHHDIGELDIFDAAPFSFDDHHVIQPDRFGKGHPDARDQVLERRLGSSADC